MNSDRVLASPPGVCCIKTVEHTGTAVGVAEDIGTLNTYVLFPPKKEDTYDRIIFFFSDVYGPFYINNQLLMDYFASRGYLVVGPDCFAGEPISKVKTDPDFGSYAWAKSHRERADALLPGWIQAMKAKYGYGNTRYAAVGYCFGGPDPVDLAATDWLAAGAIVHPAYITEGRIRKVKQPLLMSCSEIDFTFPTSSRHRAEEILVEIKADYHIQVFGKVDHGFGVRGDPSIPEQKWAKEQSAKTVIDWFDRFCI